MKIDKSVRATLRQLRSEYVSVQGRRVPKSVAFLTQMAANSEPNDDLDDVLFHLAGEYAMAGMVNEQANTLRLRVENLPSDVNAWLSLADCLSGLPGGETEARSALETGIHRARRSNEFVRTALAVQARIARRWRDADLYRDAITQLIADAQNEREVDQGFESDIVEDLPAGFCPSDLIEKYLDTGARRT